jgi:hypothetical protein
MTVQSVGSETADVEVVDDLVEAMYPGQPKISKLLSGRGEHLMRVNLVDTTDIRPSLPGAMPDAEGCDETQQ